MKTIKVLSLLYWMDDRFKNLLSYIEYFQRFLNQKSA